MLRARAWWFVLLAVTAMPPAVASAEGVSVDVTADRGNSAVYQPGERIKLQARCSDDANLLIYDIDAEGQVTVLFPYHGISGYVAGRQTIPIPDGSTSDDLVVQGPVGQGYIVAIASHAPFRDLPWYLRPYDPQAEGVGYIGGPDSAADNDEGVTAQGRIVGDPFVAMERIRRRVLSSPDDRDSFGSSYITYYVHDRVRYPRYICSDCHRPGYYAWWDGFDPYYTTCSVVSFHVNFGWSWGWPYWGGYVPYYVYVVNPWAPPYYGPWAGYCYSSWDGWSRWNGMWGSHIVRYKPASPPPGYIPPAKYQWDSRWQTKQPAPPGFLTVASASKRTPVQRMPATSVPGTQIVSRTDWRPGGELRQPVTRSPAVQAPRENGTPGVTVDRGRAPVGRAPAGVPGEGRTPSGAPDQGRAPSGGNTPGVSGVPQRTPQTPTPAQRPQREDPPPVVRDPGRGERPQPPSSPPQNFYRRLAPPGGPSWRSQRPAPSQGIQSYRRLAPPSGSWSRQRPAPSQGYGRAVPSRGAQRPAGTAPQGSRGGGGGRSGERGGERGGR